MTTYTFLTRNQNQEEGIVRYFAVGSERIERFPMSDSYSDFGQPIGADDAGDYLELSTSDAVAFANQAYHNEYAEYDDSEVLEHYKIGDTINAYDEYRVYIAVLNKFEGTEHISIEKTWVEGFNYWNGSNHRSVITDQEHGGMGNYSVVNDEELTAKLNEAIQNMAFVSKGFGTETYTAPGFEIVESYCQGAWEKYTITPSEDEN